MTLHTIKIQKKYFLDFYRKKTFEIINHDGDYHVNDLVHFINTNQKDFINEPNNVFMITYVLKDLPEHYGKGNVILGIKQIAQEN